MWVVLATLTMAAMSPLRVDSPPAGSDLVFRNEEAVRRYVQGRLLEERGQNGEALGQFYRTLLLDSKAASVARRVSEVYARVGDADRSLEFAERSLTLEPGDARGRWLKGTALFHLGRGGESQVWLEAAVAADSGRVEYLQSLARVAESLDQIPVVARAYRRAVELDDDDAESWFQLAAAEARLGNFEAASKAVTTAARLNPVRPGILFLRGWVSEGIGRPREAVDLYRNHLAIHAGDQVTRRRLVNLLARQRRYEEAYQEAKELTRAGAVDLGALEVETELAFLAKRRTEGLRRLREVQQTVREDPEFLAGVYGLMARHGLGGAAVKDADRWESSHPHDYRGPMLAARARLSAGRPESAVSHAQKAVAMAPDSLAPRVLLGRLHQEGGRFREAEEVWGEAVARFPSRVGIWLDLAFCRERLGDIAGAEAAVRDLMKREPNNPIVLNFLGYLLADHDRNLDEALDLIQQAIEQEPDNGAFVDSLGWVYYRLGRLHEARRELERAVGLTGGDPVVHEHLGDVYKDLQLLDLAELHYRKSLAGDRSNERVKAKLAEIR